MNEILKINKENFKVLKGEFQQIPHDEFNNLDILDSLGLFERLISLLQELTLLFESKPNIIFYNITHGGYIPIKCSNDFKNVFIYNDIDCHNENILANIYTHEISNISIVDKSLINKLFSDFKSNHNFKPFSPNNINNKIIIIKNKKIKEPIIFLNFIFTQIFFSICSITLGNYKKI